MKLHLGVIDIAYSDPEVSGVTTTGEVARKLEDEYDVMQVFYDLDEKKIVGAVADVLQEMVESMMQGNPDARITDSPIGDIQRMFQDYLSRDDWQKITGRTILAAQLGISHRFKDAKNEAATRGSRPAFIDTGTYRANMIAWLGDDA